MFSTNWESGGFGKWSLNNTDLVRSGVADFRLPIADLVFALSLCIRNLALLNQAQKTKYQIGNRQSEIVNGLTQIAF